MYPPLPVALTSHLMKWVRAEGEDGTSRHMGRVCFGGSSLPRYRKKKTTRIISTNNVVWNQDAEGYCEPWSAVVKYGREEDLELGDNMRRVMNNVQSYRNVRKTCGAPLMFGLPHFSLIQFVLLRVITQSYHQLSPHDGLRVLAEQHNLTWSAQGTQNIG